MTITKARKLQLRAEQDLTRILYDARAKARTQSLEEARIQNVINHYLGL